jgi:hypothetical protein
VALVIQHTKRMCRILLSSVASPAVPYFSTLSYKRHDFRGKFIDYKICIDFLSKSYMKHLIPIRTQRNIIINVQMSSRKVPVNIVQFQ